jgi:hypothetical protein
VVSGKIITITDGKTLVAHSNERLHSVLAELEECRTALTGSGDGETALLVSVAILDLRMKLHGIGDSELKALCDAMAPEDAPTRLSPASKARRPPLLRLVK